MIRDEAKLVGVAGIFGRSKFSVMPAPPVTFMAPGEGAMRVGRPGENEVLSLEMSSKYSPLKSSSGLIFFLTDRHLNLRSWHCGSASLVIG